MSTATAQKRTLSQAAQAAKRVREYAKSIGIKCKASSDTYSMGSSVHWSVTDCHPDDFKKIKQFADQHQYGHFDGMTDYYELSNRRDDIPQAKYVIERREFSDELRAKAYAWLRAQYPGNADNLPEDYTEAQELSWYTGEKDYQVRDMVSRNSNR